jgi:SRSO17 transposase
LLPSERNKTLTGLVNTEPLVGAQLPRAQKLHWFLCESTWDERQIQAERLKLLRDNPATAPKAQGALVIDETGVSLDGHKTAHVARQYLGNVGKIENGVVSVSSLWADEDVYYPLEVEPYTPESYFAEAQARSGVPYQTQDRLAARPPSGGAAVAVPGGGSRLPRCARIAA